MAQELKTIVPRALTENEIASVSEHGWVKLDRLVSEEDAGTMLERLKAYMGEDALDEELFTDVPLLPNTADWHGRFRWKLNRGNDYLIDRGKQRRLENFAGLSNVIVEDSMRSESMGPIVDVCAAVVRRGG